MPIENNILEVLVEGFVSPILQIGDIDKLRRKQMAGVNPGGISRSNIGIT